MVRLPAARLAHALADERLHLVVLPTEACNFRCTYCYEDFAHGRMPEPVVRGLELWLERRAAGLRELELDWFGGEPLLALDTIERLLAHVARLRAAHPRLAFASQMTTNAWLLTRERFERLLAAGVRSWQIAFDGPEDLHDAKRKLAGGGATFARVWDNVSALRAVEGDFELRLRVHVDRTNRAALPDFLARCAEAFAGDPRFRLFLRPLSRLGGKSDATLAVLEDDEGEALDAARTQARERGLSLLDVLDELPVCHAALGNSFVVRADGRLAKCTVALSNPANDVGRLHADGTVSIDGTRSGPWLRGLFGGTRAELVCPLVRLPSA